MTFHIRDATRADFSQITAIYDYAVRNETASFELSPPSQDEMLARFEGLTGTHFPYIVAEQEDDTILGYAYAGPYRSRPAYRWTVENSVYLTKEARGQGVGRALLAETIERCTTLGFRQMVAVIGGSGHDASIGLHAALGFEHVGTMRNVGFKHETWLDTVIMQKQLGEAGQTAPDISTYPGNLYDGS